MSGGATESRAIREAITARVPRADDRAILDRALVERAALGRATVEQGVERFPSAHHHDFHSSYLDSDGVRVLQAGLIRHCRPVPGCFQKGRVVNADRLSEREV